MSERKPTFFTSDWHVGHKNVITFDQRPFRDVDHMHSVLANNYNSTVPQDGICYVIGDCGLSGGSGELKKFMDRLNDSTKVLIVGNHDKGVNAMYTAGFDAVLNSGALYIGKHRITMSHCPLPGIFREDVSGMKGSQPGENWHGEHKNHQFMTHDKSDFHLHGHIHSDGKVKPRTTHNQFDVGVRANGYRPVSISEIESWIANSPRK